MGCRPHPRARRISGLLLARPESTRSRHGSAIANGSSPIAPPRPTPARSGCSRSPFDRTFRRPCARMRAPSRTLSHSSTARSRAGSEGQSGAWTPGRRRLVSTLMRAVDSRHEARKKLRSRIATFVGALAWVAACSDAPTPSPSDAGVEAGPSDDAAVSRDTNSDGDRPFCDSRVVTCESLPPNCGKGEVPVVTGVCWAGYCARASTCSSVKDCSVCDLDVDVCARDAYVPFDARCVELPSACAGDRSCNCLASYVCTRPGFHTCATLPDGTFGCACIDCFR